MKSKWKLPSRIPIRSALFNMRFIDLRRRLCQDKAELSPSPSSSKQHSEGCLLVTRKSESHNSLHLEIDKFQHKLSFTPGSRTKSEVFQKLPGSPSSVNIDLSCDNDSGKTLSCHLIGQLPPIQPSDWLCQDPVCDEPINKRIESQWSNLKLF